ncbi:MAG: hypothetical protein HYY17_11325 [Planctomycetes bacterium]|nr:hypothetical protein [Planctomycetota bacterium]
MTDKHKISQRAQAVRLNFFAKLEGLRIRLSLRLDLLQQGRKFSETQDQVAWALGELDRIRHHYDNGLPWPAGGWDWAVRNSWPAESDLREELLGLEGEYVKLANRKKGDGETGG